MKKSAILNKNVYLQCIDCLSGQYVYIRKRFLLYPKIEIAKFQSRRIETIWRSFVFVYVCPYWLMPVWITYISIRREYCFFIHFYEAFGDA